MLFLFLRYEAGQLKIMCVGGPNVRKDYHIDEGEEVMNYRFIKSCILIPVIEVKWSSLRQVKNRFILNQSINSLAKLQLAALKFKWFTVSIICSLIVFVGQNKIQVKGVSA